MNYLSILDIFGVEFKQQIQQNVKKQKSAVGGIASILIIGTSLAYLVYVFKQWFDYELLPKTSNNQQVEEQSTFSYNETENFFEFLYQNITNNNIDPFTPTNNILTPLGLYFENGTLVQIVSFLNATAKKSTYGTLKYGLNQINLSQNTQADSAQLNVREFMLVIIKCNEKYLSEGQSCASEEQFQQFFQSSNNYLLFKINLTEYNSATQKNKIVTKTYYFTLDSEIATQGRLFIKQTHAYIDTGRMLESTTKETFVQDATFLTFSTRTNFLDYIVGEECYLNMIFRLDPVITQLHIVYPKLGEILAQIGSIANLLFLLRFLVLYYNEKILEDYITDQILSFYFLNFFDVKKQQKHEHKQLYKVLTKEAHQKLVYINIIYELSRIQLFLQAQFGRDKLNQSHKLGIKLPNVDLGQKNELGKLVNDSERVIIPDSNEKFNIEDFFLFSQPKTVQIPDFMNSNINT